MMKYLVRVLVFCLLLAGCGNKEPQQVEFFTHEGCPYCSKALKYIQINYPQLPLKVMEISTPGNMHRFVLCAEKFKLNKKKLGTPLICMKDHYIMGWSAENRLLFDEYVKRYLPKK